MEMEMEMEINTNSIIDNCSITHFAFKNIKEISKFRLMERTEQSNFMTKYISPNIRVISEKKGMLYYYNNKKLIWVLIDKPQYDNYIYDFLLNSNKEIKTILRRVAEEVEDDVATKTRALCALFDNRTYIDDIIARSFTKLYDSRFLPLLDASRDYLPIKNGKKINFQTLDISDRTAKDYFTYECPVDFLGENTKTPNADKFFTDLFPNELNREYVRKSLGYQLTADTKAQVFFIWYGYGSNGKSLLFKILECILGPQYCQVDKSVFVKGKKDKGAATPELMHLLGKRSGCYSEGETADNMEMNEAGLKQISGEDKLTGRALYGNQVEFYPYIKINMATNYIPSLSADDAIKRRLRYIFFDRIFKSNPTKNNELKIDIEFGHKLTHDYLSEVFTWIIKGSKEYFKDKQIKMSPEFEQRTIKALEEGDSIETFIKRQLVKTGNDKHTITKNSLFEAYKIFCNNNSQRCITRSTLWARMSQNGFLTRCLHGYDVYTGFTLKSEIDASTSDCLDYGIKNEKDELIESLQKEIEELKSKLMKGKSKKKKKSKPEEPKEPTESELEEELNNLI